MSDAYDARPWTALYPPDVPADLPLPTRTPLQMFAAAASSGPDRPCLHYFTQTLTFAEVDRASDALAAALVATGFEPGDRIGLFLQNVPQFVIAQLAGWKAAGIVVTLSPMLKGRELGHHLADAGARVLVAQDDLYADVAAAILADSPVQLTITTNAADTLGAAEVPASLPVRQPVAAGVQDWRALLEQYDGQHAPRPSTALDDVAYLVYTSGTTGRPKGAMITHANLAFNTEALCRVFALTERDVVLGGAPLFHVTGIVAGIAASARVGAALVLFYRFDPVECLRMVERWRCTSTVMAITAYIALLDCPDIASRDVSTLRQCYSGGAPVSPALAGRWERQTGVRLHNIYGLTETTSPSHVTPLGTVGPVDHETGALSVGLPIPNTVVKIVDGDSGEVLEPGAAGELWIKGPQVVPGYWNQPDATAEALREGYLRTGDIGRMDQAGWFFIIDRSKDMIIASGYKVWPREVEDQLYEHPAVREAAVVGVPDDYRGETVKAYISLKAGASVEPAELITFCKERMAAYKYPRSVVILPELPKTASGKVLRRELRDGP